MLKEWLTRLRFLIFPKPHREIDDELQFHIEQQAQEYIAAGMTPRETHRRAVVAFGGIESARTQSHEQRPSFFLGTLLQDVSYALRQLRKSRAWFCVRYIESQLYETKGMNLTVLAVATLTLTAAAAAAGLIPAQRAASTNPSQALRTE
jgi:hypothetical protein